MHNKITTDLISPEFLRSIESMTPQDARSSSMDAIRATSTKTVRKNAILRDLEVAPNSREVSRIMWNVYLSGDGNAIIGSKWQRNYK